MKIYLVMVVLFALASIVRSYTSQELITFGIWRSNMANLKNPCLTWSSSRLNATVNTLFGFYLTNAKVDGIPNGCYNVSYSCLGTTVLSNVLPRPRTWDSSNYYYPSVWGNIIPMRILANSLDPSDHGCKLDQTYYPPRSVQSNLCTSVCASQYNPSATTLPPPSQGQTSDPTTDSPTTTTTTTTPIAPSCYPNDYNCVDDRCCTSTLEDCKVSCMQCAKGIKGKCYRSCISKFAQCLFQNHMSEYDIDCTQ